MTTTDWHAKAVAQCNAMHDTLANIDYYRTYPATFGDLPIDHVLLTEDDRLIIVFTNGHGLALLYVTGTGHGPACRWVACETCEANWMGGTHPYKIVKS